MRRHSLYGLLSVSALLVGCNVSYPNLDVVESVDLTRYAGLWYEIASYPTVFQSGCTGTTAEYTLQDDGTVQVVNICNTGSLTGPVNTITGRARVPDPSVPAKLKVSFFGPFEADYWIIDLGENYEYAVIGNPSRAYLWILSRTPTLDDQTYQQILESLPAKGYDPSRLVETLQPQ